MDKTVGYAQAANSHDADHKIAQLREAGCLDVFVDLDSEPSENRLTEALWALQPGDTLLVSEENHLLRFERHNERATRHARDGGYSLKALDAFPHELAMKIETALSLREQERKLLVQSFSGN